MRYKSYLGDQSFSSRVKHADISNEPGPELLKEGYIPIGSFKMTQQPDREREVDPTSRARVIAVKYGGELLTLSANNEVRTKVKREKTKCLESKRQMVREWDPYEGVNVWKDIEECVRWEYKALKTRVIESAGIIWRKEPEILKKHADRIMFKLIEDNKPVLVRAFIENNYVKVNITDKFGWTPLMFVSFYGGEENYKLAGHLLKEGADVNARDSGGKTALMRAVINGNMDIAELLMKNGANPGAVDNTGKSAIDYASEEDRSIIRKWVEQ